MNKIIRHLGACALLAFAASQPALAQGDAAKSVEAANATWDKAFNSGDAHALAALYDEKAVVSPGNGKAVKGRADIEKLFKGAFDAGFRDHKTEVVAAHRDGKVIYETANWSAVSEKDGKKTEYKGVLLKVMTLGSDGKWRASAHTWNAAP
jgi:uncharacterized protein (TIGR02246 family)